jgi:ATP-dependent DNA helicase PIF1
MNINNLSPEQKYALEKFKRGENLFITGAGGTGKTTLIKHFIEYAEFVKKSIQVCALTGCSAVLLNCNARTIHSWSGIRLARGPKEKIIESVFKNKRQSRNWKKVKILIVDEVSMMSRKIFEVLDEIGKVIRHSSLPFGGIQVVFTGDFFQLPPVGTMGEPETEEFCFESAEWLRTFKSENHIELETIFRQTDKPYIEILSEIRRGQLSEKNIEVLKQYVKREYDQTKIIQPTKLFPIRAKVDYVNSMMFHKLDEDEYQFEYSIKTDCRMYIDSGTPFTMEQIIKCDKMTNQEKDYEIENLVNNTTCEKFLTLKKGASVLCTVNLDIENSICNGSQGVIVDIEEIGTTTAIRVKFSNGIMKTIEPYYWQSEEFPCIAIKQYPLMLAWAMTIHKIQGATLDMAEIDIGQTVFEYGQTYVALSRIKSLDGLYLSAFQPERIRTNPKVIDFYKTIPKVDYNKIEPIDFKAYELTEETFTKEKSNIKIIKL